jgi:hypothetical protein
VSRPILYASSRTAAGSWSSTIHMAFDASRDRRFWRPTAQLLIGAAGWLAFARRRRSPQALDDTTVVSMAAGRGLCRKR